MSLLIFTLKSTLFADGLQVKSDNLLNNQMAKHNIKKELLSEIFVDQLDVFKSSLTTNTSKSDIHLLMCILEEIKYS